MKRITLCGSTRFKREFEAINKQLTLEGNVVYSVSCFGHADKIDFKPEQKELLDRVHKMKIDNSDGIFVLDVDGYIGDSTRSEIEYASTTGKFVKYLSDFPDLKWISDAAMVSGIPASPSEDKGGECPSCGAAWNTKLHNSCACGASIKLPTHPSPAPVPQTPSTGQQRMVGKFPYPDVIEVWNKLSFEEDGYRIMTEDLFTTAIEELTKSK